MIDKVLQSIYKSILNDLTYDGFTLFESVIVRDHYLKRYGKFNFLSNFVIDPHPPKTTEFADLRNRYETK